ncbi:MULTISPECIES: hypothetical protein [Shewanella]|uniref:DUF3300 domain-containing protein n=1 Tax=Shewanella marisflavi TaxID=260364 RepID=A0ABX5WJW1_9GAMM|nr:MULTISPECIES: hypothetical protein [Shewanella]QDF73970.1 hypothetical protein FGA12_01660 [Shewanella marisflavi]
MKHKIRPLLLVKGALLLSLLPLTLMPAWALKIDNQFHVSSDFGVNTGWEYRHDWDRGYYDPWRWRIGIGTGFPYWRHNHYGYWRDRWRYPYRFEPRKYRKPKPIAPPQQVTTSLTQSDAIKSLPANARVRIKEGRTIYEWQGVEYVYDWNSDSYVKLE